MIFPIFLSLFQLFTRAVWNELVSTADVHTWWPLETGDYIRLQDNDFLSHSNYVTCSFADPPLNILGSVTKIGKRRLRPVPRYATVLNIDENHINSTDVTLMEKNTSERKQFHEEEFSATDEMYILVQLNNLTARPGACYLKAL